MIQTARRTALAGPEPWSEPEFAAPGRAASPAALYSMPQGPRRAFTHATTKPIVAPKGPWRM